MSIKPELPEWVAARLKSGAVKSYREALLEQQAYKCALCGADCTKEEAVLDHDHKSGAVRAVLHRACNSGLGAIERVGRYGIKDILRFASGAAQYLVAHQTNQTNVFHPTHLCEEEKVLKRTKRAKRKKAQAKLLKEQNGK